jgi:hypothetical protein
LCAAQGGNATTTKDRQKIGSGTRQFIVGDLAQKARSWLDLAFFALRDSAASSSLPVFHAETERKRERSGTSFNASAILTRLREWS